MAWRLAKSLSRLQTQVNKQWPKRSKASDGTIGDTAHSSRASQHNPNSKGVVTAMDITHDPKNGADMNKLKHQLIKDSRTWYVIFNRRIWEKGKWYDYKGANPHDKHLHISTKQEAKYYDNPKSWVIVEDMLTNQDISEQFRLFRGTAPTKAQRKKYVGKVTRAKMSLILRRSETYDALIKKAKAGKLDARNFLPESIREVYKPPK